MSCEICGDENYKTLGVPAVEPGIEKFIRLDYRAVKCKNCGFYYVIPEVDLTPFEWNQIFEKFFPLNSKDTERRRNIIKNRFDKLVELAGVKDIDYLDAGCREGLAVQEALSRGWNVSAADIADIRQNGAKAEGVSFFEGSLDNLNFKENKFDIIYADMPLVYSSEPVKYLRKIKDLLKEEGAAFISAPDEDSGFAKLRDLALQTGGKTIDSVSPFRYPFTLSGFNEGTLRKAVENAGLKISGFDLSQAESLFKRKSYLEIIIGNL